MTVNVYATPEDDRLALREFFAQRFPDLDLNEMINGLYAFDEGAREQWLEMEDFPPYEIAIEEGEELSIRRSPTAKAMRIVLRTVVLASSRIIPVSMRIPARSLPWSMPSTSAGQTMGKNRCHG